MIFFKMRPGCRTLELGKLTLRVIFDVESNIEVEKILIAHLDIKTCEKHTYTDIGLLLNNVCWSKLGTTEDFWHAITTG